MITVGEAKRTIVIWWKHYMRREVVINLGPRPVWNIVLAALCAALLFGIIFREGFERGQMATIKAAYKIVSTSVDEQGNYHLKGAKRRTRV